MNSDTQERVTFIHVDLETDEGDPDKFVANWPRHSEKAKIEKLIEFREYQMRLSHAAKIKVSGSESGFTEKQSYFLQRKMCVSVSDVANRSMFDSRRSQKPSSFCWAVSFYLHTLGFCLILKSKLK